MIFGAKEAFYKCQYAITRTWLGFEGVHVRVGGDRFELSVVEPEHPIRRVQSEWVGQFALDDRFVVAAVAAERRREG